MCMCVCIYIYIILGLFPAAVRLQYSQAIIIVRQRLCRNCERMEHVRGCETAHWEAEVAVCPEKSTCSIGLGKAAKLRGSVGRAM
jgi:hypothetical protein